MEEGRAITIGGPRARDVDIQFGIQQWGGWKMDVVIEKGIIKIRSDGRLTQVESVTADEVGARPVEIRLTDVHRRFWSATDLVFGFGAGIALKGGVVIQIEKVRSVAPLP